MPSISTKVESDSPPRGNNDVRPPRPPLLVTVKPGIPCKAPETVSTCRALRSAALMTSMLSNTWDRGRSTCAAETTIDSVIALTRSWIRMSRCSSAASSSVTTSAPKPSSATRSSYGPGSRLAIWNRPRSSVSVVAIVAVGPESKIRAPGVTRPSGSMTTPCTAAAAARPGGSAAANPSARTYVWMDLVRDIGLLSA